MALLRGVTHDRRWECGLHLGVHQPVDVRRNKVVHPIIELVPLLLNDHLVCEAVVLFEREVGRIVVVDFLYCFAKGRPRIWCRSVGSTL